MILAAAVGSGCGGDTDLGVEDGPDAAAANAVCAGIPASMTGSCWVDGTEAKGMNCVACCQLSNSTAWSNTAQYVSLCSR